MLRGWLLLVFGLAMTGGAMAQNTPVNLVPNGDFEEHDYCPTSASSFSSCHNWLSYVGSTNYFHKCGTGEGGVPINFAGYQIPHSDSAYAGLATYTAVFSEGREVLAVELVNPMGGGIKYQVSLWASPMDAYNYISCCLGVRFTHPPGPPFIQNASDIELVIAENEIDTSQWYHLEGVYTAQGGEDKIYIANFRPDSESNPVYQGEITADYNSAGFYIDDVSVIEDTVTGIGELEKDGTEVSIYPNPCTNVLNIRLQDSSPPQADGMTIEVTDMLGRSIPLSKGVPEGRGIHTIDTSTWPSGIYLLRAANAQGLRSVVKVVKE
ncbi:MAG: T9SS type A sorting domain-containing protein [Flavobacteriales bacterium]|nr:T9SS type A sorting domain-containing protein [Flavobacteriales bacterium]